MTLRQDMLDFVFVKVVVVSQNKIIGQKMTECFIASLTMGTVGSATSASTENNLWMKN